MLACGVLTLVLAGALAATTSLPVAVAGLVLLGGPAGVGSSLLFAHLRHRRRAGRRGAYAGAGVVCLGGRAAAGHVPHRRVRPRAILAAIDAVAVLTIATIAG
jgi:SET family sugar efflux transporter-like MFS transporter